jgi:hypothetical protein
VDAFDVVSRGRISGVTIFSSLGALHEDGELITWMKENSEAMGRGRAAPRLAFYEQRTGA